MLNILTDPDLQPFAVAGAFVVGLLILELALMLVGLNTQFGEPDLDIDLDADLDMADMASSLDGIDTADLIDIEPLGFDTSNSDLDIDTEVSDITIENGIFSSLLNFLGITKVASAIWLAGFMAFISIFGFIGQGLLDFVGIGFLPGKLALAIVFIPALLMIAKYSHTLGKLIPSIETSAISANSFHRRRGVITGGTAETGRQAEIRWVDGHGNTHYLLAEPLEQDVSLIQGTEVLILRTRDKQAKLISLKTST